MLCRVINNYLSVYDFYEQMTSLSATFSTYVDQGTSDFLNLF